MSAATQFWPNIEHWSVQIPFHTAHVRLDALAETGFVALDDRPLDIAPGGFESLE